MEESKAIAILKEGNLQGLEELVQRHQLVAVQTAYLIVGDRPQAEDITQAAFLKVAGKIHQFEDGRPFRPWFLRIVTNDAVKASSRAKRHQSLDVALEMDLPPEWLLDPKPGPEELVDTVENRAVVWHALELLTPTQRASIVMRFFLGMKDREISEELRRPLSTIKWSIHAAKEGLRSLLRRADLPDSPLPPEANSERGAGEDR
ncbi:MAG TPA: RNA polymerase sigma factor [Thermoleophilia bacterium]|nr:RNA polymerase sigma factor [Thermoleophilia bacterium]